MINSKDITEIETVIVEVRLNKTFDVNEFVGGGSCGNIVAIRYNKNHFLRWKDRVKVYLHTESGNKGDTISCGIVGWSEDKLKKFIEKHGRCSRIITK